ncbi:hypothetical protein [Flindersiella endophytica]
MSDARTFVERFRAVQAERGYSRVSSPVELIGGWAGFVEGCEEGYDWCRAEYDNDVMVRDQIEAILTDPELAAMKELVWFRADVLAVDERFKALLRPLPGPPSAGTRWWADGVPKRAGREFADDIKAATGIDLDVVD